MEDLQGKVAVITGGASGIGKAVAGQAAAAGMKIVLADIEEGPLKETVTELAARGTDAIGAVTDVADAASVRALRDGHSTGSGPCTSCTTTRESGWADPFGRSARPTGAGSSA